MNQQKIEVTTYGGDVKFRRYGEPSRLAGKIKKIGGLLGHHFDLITNDNKQAWRDKMDLLVDCEVVTK